MHPEAVIRHQLTKELEQSAEDGAHRGTVYELWIPLSNERVDIAVIGAEMRAYEIKSERDTLKRLPRQAAAYARVFDRCTTVVAERHVAGAMELLPEWWGVTVIITDDRQPSFRNVRHPVLNVGVDPETLVRLLWREEARSALSALGCDFDPQSSRASMWHRLVNLLDTDSLKVVVRHTLIRRDPNRARIPTRRFALATGEVNG